MSEHVIKALRCLITQQEYPEPMLIEAADTIEALRAENARLLEALKPLAALRTEILDENGQPSGDFLFDTWTDDQAVFFLDRKRIITAGDIRTAYQLSKNI